MSSGGRQYVAEPFFTVLRQRHPDIDLVVLPPVGIEEERPEVLTGDLKRSLSTVAAAVTTISTRVPIAIVEEPTWDSLGPEGVRRRADLWADTTEGGLFLDDLDETFRQMGWRCEIAVKAYHRWTATHPEARIFGSWSEHHNSLRIRVTGRVFNAGIEMVQATTWL